MKRININDIAKAAGVSKATVSMVINDYKQIPQSTKDKVRKIMLKMNYYPHESARNLAKKRSDALAFVSTRYAAPIIAQVLDALEQRAFYRNKYVHGIIPYSTRNIEEVKEDILRKILYSRKADAVIGLFIIPTDELIKEYRERNVPLILIETFAKNVNSITVDNHKGAVKATKHLVKKGRKNIGLIVGERIQPPGKFVNVAAVNRKKGFTEVMKANGMTVSSKNTEVIHAYTYEEGREALDNLLKKNKKLDAIFCAAGDIVAMGVMKRAKELGINIPEDLSIIGYDDVMAAALLNPPLTTVRQPLAYIGELAFDMALDAVDGKLKKPKITIIEPELIVRESA